MDSLTQVALGAVVGEMALGRKLGWKAAAWGAFFGTLPDLDVIALPFLDPAAGIRWHRGWSHAILVFTLASILLGPLLARFHRERGVTGREMGWLVFWAWRTHVLIDCFTTYGTQIFEPFSDARVAMNLMFIVDPLFTLPLLVGLFLALRLPVRSVTRRRIPIIAVSLCTLYAGLALGMKTWATYELRSQLEEQGKGGRVVQVAPGSFNIILWRGLLETEEAFHLTYWSPFDSGEPVVETIPKSRDLADDFADEEVMEALRWFSRGHWVARRGDDGTLVIVDLRFTEIRDPRSGSLQPIFQWHLSRDQDGRVSAPMLRPTGLDYLGAAGLLWGRIWGNSAEWNSLRLF
jgi:inner membrane protein